MIVDAHTHVLDYRHWPTEWWHAVAEDWAGRKAGRRASDIEDRIESGLVDPDGSRLVASMDEAGVDLSILLPMDWGPDFTGTKAVTEMVAEGFRVAERHPGRILPFAGIDPRRPGAPDLMTGWLEQGARGLKLYPSCGWHPESDEAAALYAVCDAAAVPVLFHTGHPLPILDTALADPALLRGVAKSFPQMPIWLGHAGAPSWWREALELAAEFPNVRLEMSVWVWGDSTEADKELFTDHVAEALRTVGVSSLIFGSDNVSGAKERKPGFLKNVLDVYRELPERLAQRHVAFSPTDLDLILGGTALNDLQARDSLAQEGGRV